MTLQRGLESTGNRAASDDSGHNTFDARVAQLEAEGSLHADKAIAIKSKPKQHVDDAAAATETALMRLGPAAVELMTMAFESAFLASEGRTPSLPLTVRRRVAYAVGTAPNSDSLPPPVASLRSRRRGAKLSRVKHTHRRHLVLARLVETQSQRRRRRNPRRALLAPAGPHAPSAAPPPAARGRRRQQLAVGAQRLEAGALERARQVPDCDRARSTEDDDGGGAHARRVRARAGPCAPRRPAGASHHAPFVSRLPAAARGARHSSFVADGGRCCQQSACVRMRARARRTAGRSSGPRAGSRGCSGSSSGSSASTPRCTAAENENSRRACSLRPMA